MNALHFAIYYPLRPEFLQQSKEDANGLIWEPISFHPELIDKQKDFAVKFKEIYDTEATSDSAQGYDYMNNALSSISKAKSLDADKIIEQLSNLSREGLIGKFEFDQSNHTAKAGPEFLPVPAAQVQDGENQIIWPGNISTSEYEPQPWVK